MKGIRRSLNKDKIGNPTATFSSLPPSFPLNSIAQPNSKPTTTVAPAPPKKVIRASESYTTARQGELNYELGDFFHVIGEEEGDWVEASNPMTGVRGMVNLESFTILGRNVRENGSSVKGKGARVTSPQQSSYPQAQSSSSNNSQHSLRSSQTSHSNSFPTTSQLPPPPTAPAAPKSAPLYGIVQYDFTAERPDELSAVRGEPIIVIAQSNHEWFVAKPIGRLGGPGLIPVAFVEILDVITGKKIENIGELIGDGRVPKVEEWKKMTADYKSSSIPLGRFDFDQNNGVPQSNSPNLENSLSPSLSLASEDARSEGRYSYTHERSYYGLITSATVESFHQEEGSFWFHLRASFSTGTSLVLYRLYQDFYDFQIALMDSFPIEAGRDPNIPRTLPMMPGPTDSENETICAQRVVDLSKYLKELCDLGKEVRSDGLMYEFFCLRAGDVEVVRGRGEGEGEDGIEGQYGELVQYLDSMDGGNERDEDGLQKGMRALDVDERYSNYSDGQYHNGQEPKSISPSYQATYPIQSQTLSPPTLSPAPSSHPSLSTSSQPFIKIKIFHRNTDDLIAIRVPPSVTYLALLQKVKERLGNDVINLRFREEVSNGYGGATTEVVMAGGARLVGISNDEDLRAWVDSGSRLILYAD